MDKVKQFTHQDYEITQTDVLYKSLYRYVRYHLRHKLFNGEWSNIMEREVMERMSAAGILPYDPVLDKVVLISQFRPGAISPTTKDKAKSPWLYEIVAGVMDKDETPDRIAIREAKEEANCDILDIYPLNQYFVSPGGSNEYMNIFCGRISTQEINGVHGLAYEDEDIYAFTLTSEEAFELLAAGVINTAPAIIALQWLQINKGFIRDLWLTNRKKHG